MLYETANPRLPPKPTPDTEVINMSSLTRNDRIKLENAVSTYGEPSKVFDRKVTALSHILHCTEEEATEIILHRL